MQRRHKVDTTLQVHFFGKKGNQDLNYEGFYKFMDNLQTEVLELEFYEFSKGNLAITEVDFAKILLRYTYLVSSWRKTVFPHSFRTLCMFANGFVYPILRTLMNTTTIWIDFWIESNMSMAYRSKNSETFASF